MFSILHLTYPCILLTWGLLFSRLLVSFLFPWKCNEWIRWEALIILWVLFLALIFNIIYLIQMSYTIVGTVCFPGFVASLVWRMWVKLLHDGCCTGLAGQLLGRRGGSLALSQSHDPIKRVYFQSMNVLSFFAPDYLQPSLLHMGFLSLQWAETTLCCSAWASHCSGFSLRCREHRPLTCWLGYVRMEAQ